MSFNFALDINEDLGDTSAISDVINGTISAFETKQCASTALPPLAKVRLPYHLLFEEENQIEKVCHLFFIAPLKFQVFKFIFL